MAEYTTVKETTEKLNISRATLYRLIDEGLPYYSTGTRKKLFNVGEVKEFIEKRRTDTIKKPEAGEEYSNDDIVNMFRCSKTGRMRHSNTMNVLVLISYNDSEDGYWRDDILYYKGQGDDEGQNFESAKNKLLYESEKNGVIVYLFEMLTNNKYLYRGIAKLAKEPFKDDETDINGHKHKICRFPLKLVNEKDYLSEEFVKNEEIARLKTATDYIKDENIKPMISQPISEITVLSKITVNNVAVGAYVKLRANGKCELCGCEAPF